MTQHTQSFLARSFLLGLLALILPLALAAQNAEPRDFGQSAQTRNYRLDANASNVTARVSFLGLGSKTASFPRMRGTVRIVPHRPEQARINVSFNATSIEASDETTTQRLRGEKFFWAERYPTIRFVGRSLELTSPTRGTVTGELTARGVTRTEALKVTFDNKPSTVRAGTAITLTGEMEIDRRRYGMRSYQLVVGNKVKIRLRARMVPQ